MSATPKKVRINGKEYDFPSSFTLGESRVIQRESGIGLGGLEQALAIGNADVAACLIYIILRRENPAVTMEDVEALDMVTIELIKDEPAVGEGGQSPPAGAAPPPPAGGPSGAPLESETTLEPSGVPA